MNGADPINFYSLVNQQVALRTIRKLGFVATSVSNGQEALEYLKAADATPPAHPKPDIILMDVQMPIMDGYRATHIIRHHSPYKVSSRHIPIVAMTASAIQGEREKCKRAGMDDYLSKPVMRHNLEKMLVRWSMKKHQFRARSDDQSECSVSEPGSRCDASPSPSTFEPETVPEKSDVEVRPPMVQRQSSHRSAHLNLPGTETEGDREHMREDAEEKATALRDDKLMDVAGGGAGAKHDMSNRNRSRDLHIEKLTVENVERLDEEAGEASRMWDERDEDDTPRTTDLDQDLSPTSRSPAERWSEEDNEEDASNQSSERPAIRRRWQDSEMTVTPGGRT